MGSAVETRVQAIFQKCAGKSGCDVCRSHMEEDCLFFPELYRLSDRIIESGSPLDPEMINPLLDLCTLCGLCPCQDIRMLILGAKAAVNNGKGASLSGRVLSDVEKLGRWGSCFPGTMNFLNGNNPISFAIKKMLDIQGNWQLPCFPRENFFLWAKRRGLCNPGRKIKHNPKKVAYFAGCSAGYLFPEIGKAAVTILEKNKVHVFVPPQVCCGMPLLVEGRREMALNKININVKTILSAIQDGYQVVCSCPTCGYFFKNLLLENAYYSDAFQKKSTPGKKNMKIPLGSGGSTFIFLPKNTYKKILQDDGYFSSVDPLARIELSQKIKDLGEYLLSLYRENEFDVELPDSLPPMQYYAPCHQREQEIGQPYFQLMRSIPGFDIIQTGGAFDCCGMGGHLGVKASFTSAGHAIGKPLFDKFILEKGRVILTDCLSCRMKFEQELPAKVFHPLEWLTMKGHPL